MAEYDDDRPDFDDAFADEPPEEPGRRRGTSRRGGRARKAPGERARGARGRPRGRRPAGRGRGGAGAGGGAVALRRPGTRALLGLLFAAVLITVIVLVVRECQQSRLEESYTRYMNSVAQIVSESAEQGQQLRQVLRNQQGRRPPQLRQQIRQIANQARELAERADGLDPPGSLTSAQRSFVTTLEYRVTGLSSLADVIPGLLQSRDEDVRANGLAAVMQRFLASDVIYEDSFEGPARGALESDGIGGVEVPPKQPFLPNPALASPEGAGTLIPNLQRRGRQQGGADGADGNLRGTSLERVDAMPAESRLTPGETVSIQASEQLKWRVTVMNGGDFDESGIVVRATFRYPTSPEDAEVRETAIEELASGATTTVEIPGPTNPVFGEVASLLVEIEPVPGETNVDNNSAEYAVRIVI